MFTLNRKNYPEKLLKAMMKHREIKYDGNGKKLHCLLLERL